MDAHDRAGAAVKSPGDALIERLAERVGGHAKVEAVFGTPIQQGELMIVPVARVRWGVGGGGGVDRRDDGAASGSGGGGGVAADPVGYIEMTNAGVIFRPISDAFPSPPLILASALAAAVVLRALAKFRR
jgi:uncharacterized spore protein YtfJ